MLGFDLGSSAAALLPGALPDASYELPIRYPVKKTSTPPTIT